MRMTAWERKTTKTSANCISRILSASRKFGTPQFAAVTKPTSVLEKGVEEVRKGQQAIGTAVENIPKNPPNWNGWTKAANQRMDVIEVEIWSNQDYQSAQLTSIMIVMNSRSEQRNAENIERWSQLDIAKEISWNISGTKIWLCATAWLGTLICQTSKSIRCWENKMVERNRGDQKKS